MWDRVWERREVWEVKTRMVRREKAERKILNGDSRVEESGRDKYYSTLKTVKKEEEGLKQKWAERILCLERVWTKKIEKGTN